MFYRRVLTIELDRLSYDNPDDKEVVDGLFNIQKLNFNKVDSPQVGDIIVFRVQGLAGHVGVFLKENQFVHTMRKTNCCVERLDRWNRKIIGFYRWPSLNIQ